MPRHNLAGPTGSYLKGYLSRRAPIGSLSSHTYEGACVKLSLVEFLFRGIGPAAQDMAPGSMSLCAAERDGLDGTSRSMPIVILKGESDARLRPTKPGFLIGVVEAPDCPMRQPLSADLLSITPDFPHSRSLKPTRRAGENAMAPGLPCCSRMKGTSPSRRAA